MPPSRVTMPENPQYRTASIDKFLASLTPWEALYLRNALRNGKAAISSDAFAGLDSLPPEILCHISDELYLEDLLGCWAVSRSWRNSWERYAVSSYLCHRFFTGLLEVTTAHQQQQQHSLGPKPPVLAGRLFRQAAVKYLRLRAVCPRQKGFIHWDRSWNTDLFVNKNPRPPSEPGMLDRTSSSSCPVPPMVYGEGKVAWIADGTRLLVDDLVTRQRQICSLTDAHVAGDHLLLKAVNKRLVVLLFEGYFRDSSRPKCQAHIWHLDTETWGKVSLPFSMEECYVDDDRVSFSLGNGHVYLWQWGGATLELDVDHALTQPKMRRMADSPIQQRPGVIWHPFMRHVMYLCWVGRNATFAQGIEDEPGECPVIIVKYTNATPTQCFYFDIRLDRSQRLDCRGAPRSDLQSSLNIRRTTSHGDWQICLLGDTGSSQAPVLAIAFNVISETFYKRHFGNPIRFLAYSFAGNLDQGRSISEKAVWDDKLESHSPIRQINVFPSDTWGHVRSRIAHGLWNPPFQSMQSKPRLFEIYGDGDFLLYSGEWGLWVWAYADAPKLPHAN